MKYLRLYKENSEDSKKFEVDEKFIEELKKMKYLPYSEFISELKMRIQDPEFLNKLKSLSQRGEEVFGDYGSIKEVDIPAYYLMPTQSQIGIEESLSWLQNLSGAENIILEDKASLFDKNRILIANQKWILDGHHRHAFVYMLSKTAKIPCININLPEKSPNNIMKDLQLSILSTYGDLYTKEADIDYNLSLMKDDDIFDLIYEILQGEELELLKYSYGQEDISKSVLREFIIKESTDPNENDYKSLVRDTNIPSDDDESESGTKHEAFSEIDNADKEKESNLNKNLDDAQTILDVAGFIDPSGIVDILNGLGYLYRGQYFSAVCSFASAAPGVDFFAKPLKELALEMTKSVAISTAYKKSLQGFGKALTNLDAKSAAKHWIQVEKNAFKKVDGKYVDEELANKVTQFNGALDALKDKSTTILGYLGKLMTVIGNNWLKFKIFYWLWGNNLTQFFKDLYYWREKLAYSLNNLSKEEVVGIIASNAIRLKRTIIDKKIDKLNTNYINGIHPLQIAIKTNSEPYSGTFHGVPSKFLEKLPTILNRLEGSEIGDIESQIIGYAQFEPEETPSPQIQAKPEPTAQIKPETPKPQSIKELPSEDSLKKVVDEEKPKTIELPKEDTKPKVQPIKSDTTNIKPKTGKIKKITEF
jgi:hypothetical protein